VSERLPDKTEFRNLTGTWSIVYKLSSFLVAGIRCCLLLASCAAFIEIFNNFIVLSPLIHSWTKMSGLGEFEWRRADADITMQQA
jgi:hypothetical protein